MKAIHFEVDGDPAEVVMAVGESSRITGADLLVDGGFAQG